MTFQDHFSEQAKQYSKHRPRYPAALFEYLASLAPERELAWDARTGNGQAALELTRHFQRVIATDASADQIANAFQHERIEYRTEPAENTSFSAHTVDLVTVGQAVHWFDFEAFYREVRRVAKPNAVLSLWTYHLPVISPAVDKSLLTFMRETLAGYWPERFHHVDDRYRSLPFPFPEITVPQFKMEADWSLDELIGFLASWSATQKYLNARGVHPVDIILDELQQSWGDASARKRVEWELFLRVGRVGGS